MNINTNIQSFSSQSGIKVTQNGNSNQSIDKNKNSEAVNINIDSKTLDTLNLLSFLGEETITSPINNLNYSIILYGKNRCKKIITQRVV